MKTRHLLPLLLFLIPLSSPCASPNDARNPWRLHGSDLFQGWMEDALNAREAKSATPSVYQCRFEGSNSALSALYKGWADAALVITESPPELSDRFEVHQVARYCLFAYTDNSNPIEALSVDQLRRIATSDTGNQIRTWQDLSPDATDTPLNSPIRLLIAEGYLHIASSHLLKLLSIKANAEVQALILDPEAIDASLQKDRNWILISDQPSLPTPTSKRLALAAKDETVPFLPTEENLNYADYPSAAQILLISKRADPRCAELLATFSHPEWVERFRSHNLIPSQSH
jgi:hypothetical protein